MPRKQAAKELTAELVIAVREIYNSDVPVTVNGVRQRVEEKLDLDEGFFKEADWKDKSKEIIKDAVVSTRTQLSQAPTKGLR
jgi:hypothetical protein